MSKMTTLVGPPLDSGMLDSIRASVKAVATSPSASTCSATMLLNLMRLSNTTGYLEICSCATGGYSTELQQAGSVI